jgi:thiamine-monophosphate kinase
MNEFGLIKRYFQQRQTRARADVLLGIGDDCALLTVPAGQALAISIDTSVVGVHFPGSTPAHAIGHKTLAVSLSDLAAMGAQPAWVTIAATLPELDETWVNEFSEGLFALADRYQVAVVGGDTSRGPLTITTQVHGFVPDHQALRRNAAKIGDAIWVSGTLADAALGLAAVQHKAAGLSAEHRQFVIDRLNYPSPRVELGLALRGLAHAAIDLSDGLAGDLGHILQQSQVGATLALNNLPLSSALQTLPHEQAWQLALSGGDDYELCFTAPAAHTAKIQQIAKDLALPLTQIGVIEQQAGLRIRSADGKIHTIDAKGYQHF